MLPALAAKTPTPMLGSKGAFDANPVLTPSTACERCREQKLKCSRDLPICVRCRRQNARCNYPKPADRRGRKGGAKSTATPQRRQRPGAPNRESRAVTLHELQTLPPPEPLLACSPRGLMPPGEAYRENMGNSPSRPLLQVRDQPKDKAATRDAIEMDPQRNELPSRAVGLALLEIYFSRIYNAPLLFHKASFFQDFLENKIPAYLSEAVFALASLFIVRGAPCTSSETNMLADFSGNGRVWARNASQKAFLLASECPSLTVIQTLECLCLYWFAVGDLQRADLSLALAYRSCVMLGYNKYCPGRDLPPDADLQSELKRRALWACWASLCICCEPLSFARSSWLDVADLPLPADIVPSDLGYSIKARETMNTQWDALPCEQTYLGESSPDTVMAAVIKLIGVWAKCQLFVREPPSSSSQMIHDLYTLSALANSIYESSSQRSGLGQIDLSATREQDADLQLLFQSLFYLCQMTLHSNIVPAFSALPSNPKISSDIVRTSAEAVVNHATAFTDILHEYLQRPDMSKVAPLVGYTAFISGLVFILKSRINPASHDEVERRTADCRFLLDTLCFYWQPLRRVQKNLHRAMSSQEFLKGPGSSAAVSTTVPGYVCHHESQRTQSKISFEPCEVTPLAQSISEPLEPRFRPPESSIATAGCLREQEESLSYSMSRNNPQLLDISAPPNGGLPECDEATSPVSTFDDWWNIQDFNPPLPLDTFPLFGEQMF